MKCKKIPPNQLGVVLFWLLTLFVYPLSYILWPIHFFSAFVFLTWNLKLFYFGWPSLKLAKIKPDIGSNIKQQ
jgi:hypothetical protein